MPDVEAGAGWFAGGCIVAHEMGHHVQQLLGTLGRVAAAAVVGDDFQRRAAGAPPALETWTHGSSAQRQRWVTAGLEQGRPAACDTFGAA